MKENGEYENKLVEEILTTRDKGRERECSSLAGNFWSSNPGSRRLGFGLERRFRRKRRR